MKHQFKEAHEVGKKNQFTYLCDNFSNTTRPLVYNNNNISGRLSIKTEENGGREFGKDQRHYS